jgi:hypothetical protein
MSDKLKTMQVNPYDLSAARRGASIAAPKAPSSMRQPYALASSYRFVKLTVVLRAKKTD